MSEAETKPELTRLGSYAIVRKLARGGMAELFLARSVGPEGFEKLVVLKKILPKYAENPRFVQLFLDEAKLAASLDHPHIVHVYDMGRVDGHYFFTMEYVHGQDVRTILKIASRQKQDLPLAIAVQVARTMASALHHAHERRHPDGTLRNIVHRDVSPSNILVSYDGAIKLADFGVAKAQGSSVRTRTGALKGKVGYMSPEQARGATIDRRSDIFALGVVLWELVTMRRLFKSDNDLATIQAIINTPPPPLSDLRPDCPVELDRIVRTALEKDPEKRYQTAQHLQRDLDELARELKLDQSSIVVSTFMHDVFEAEIAALKAAQSQGVTVTDYVVSHSGFGGAATTPISESELSLDDPGDPEEPDDDEIPDEDPSEPTDLPPRSGSIENDAEMEATDFGPPPTMDALRQGALNSTRAAAPRPATGSPKSSPVPKVIAKVPSAPLPAKLPTPSAGSAKVARPGKSGFEEGPFDNATTRLRPNLTSGSDPFGDNAATSVASPAYVDSPAFTEEAPTVTAPPELVKQAFAETTETTQGHRFTVPAKKKPPPGMPDEPRTSPYGNKPDLSKPPAPPEPVAPSGFEPTAVHFDPIDPPTDRPRRVDRPEIQTTPMPMRKTELGHQVPEPPRSPEPPRMPQPLPRGSRPGGLDAPPASAFGANDAFAQTMVESTPASKPELKHDTLHDPMPPAGTPVIDADEMVSTIQRPSPAASMAPPPMPVPPHLAAHLNVPSNPIYGQPLGTPPTPPIGSPAVMDPLGNVPGMYGRPAVGSQPLDPMGAMNGGLRYPTVPPGVFPDHVDVDLAPHKRWLVIGGVAVIVAVTAIVLILLLGGGSSEPEVEPDPEPTKAEPTKAEPAPVKSVEPAPLRAAGKVEAKPAAKPDEGSGSATAGSGTAAPVSTPPPPSGKVIKPPRRIPNKRGR